MHSSSSRELQCAANRTRAARARDKDAQKLITLWKFWSFYIYSTPSIPTTETTHGLYEEDFDEKSVPQEIAAQGGEEAREEES
jgi:hypothetical protein